MSIVDGICWLEGLERIDHPNYEGRQVYWRKRLVSFFTSGQCAAPGDLAELTLSQLDRAVRDRKIPSASASRGERTIFFWSVANDILCDHRSVPAPRHTDDSEWFDLHWFRLTRFFHARRVNNSDYEDLASETVSRFFGNPAYAQIPPAQQGFVMYGIAKNVHQEYLRRQKREAPWDNPDMLRVRSVSTGGPVLECVEQCLAQQDAEIHRLIQQYYLEGLTRMSSAVCTT